MKRKRKKTPSYRYFLSVVALSSYSTLAANPEGMQVVHGLVNSSSSENLLEIHSGQKAIINWDSFSIAAGETAKFIQQDANSAVLNRVMGSNLSEIYGALESNGKIFLINPSGVLVGEGARIEVGSFIASTFDILNDDFLADKGITFSGDSDHALVNLGTIRAKEGDVILIAHRVRNDGRIEAPNGEASLNSCQEFLLRPKNSKVLIRPSTKNEEEVGIENNGSIEALKVSLEADGNLYARAIEQKGVIEAKSLNTENGRIRLVAEDSRVIVTGEMTAKNGDNGGTIHVLGKEVLLLEEAQLDATGIANGGEVLLGGDYQGKNPDIYNADVTFVDKNVSILADSLSSGNGGKVILWGEKYTGYYGSISAKGGAVCGDGGFAEVSSLGLLRFENIVNLSATNGNPGLLFLDPVDIDISNAIQSIGVNLSTNPVTLPDSSSPVIINNGLLSSQLSSSDVTIDANTATGGSGNIIVENTITWSNNHTLTINTPGTLLLFSGLIDVPILMQINPSSTPPPTGNVLVVNAGKFEMDGSIVHSGTYGGIEITCNQFSVLPFAIPAGITITNVSYDLIINTNSFTFDSLSIGGFLAIGRNIVLQGKNGNGSPISSILFETAHDATISVKAGGQFSAACSSMNLSITDFNPSSISVSSLGDLTIFADTLTLSSGSSSSSTVEIFSTNGNVNISPLTPGAGAITLTNLNFTPSSTIDTVSQIYSRFGSVNITGNNLTIKDENRGSSSLNNITNQIYTSTGNINLNISNSINIFSGLSFNTQSMIYTTDGSIFINADTLNLNTTSGTTGLAGSVSSIQTIGTGNIVLNANQLNIIPTGSTSANITTVDGNISGTLQNLNIAPAGVNDAFITTTGSGNIDLKLSGPSPILNLTANTASAMIQTTGTGNIIWNQVGGSLNLTGGSGSTSKALLASNGDFNMTASDTAITLLAGGGTGSSQAFIETTNGGDINMTLTGGSLSAQGGTGTDSSSQNSSGVITYNGGNITIQPSMGGIGPNISLTGGNSNLNGLAVIECGFNSGQGSINLTSNTLTLTGGSGNASGLNGASITLGLSDNTGDITITTTSLLKLQGGTSPLAASVASINVGTNSNTNTMSITAGDLEIIAGSGTLSGAVISNFEGPLIINSLDSILIQGGTGDDANGAIVSVANPNMTISALNDITLIGGSGENSIATINASASTVAGTISITANNLSLTGGSSSGTGANVGGDAFIGIPTTAPSLADVTLSINITGLVSMEGGSNTGYNRAIIQAVPLDSNTLSFSAGSLKMLGGTGDISNALIQTGAADLTINITGDTLSLTGGSGVQSGAQIVTQGSGSITIDAVDTNITLQGGTGSEFSHASIFTFATTPVTISVTGNSLFLIGGSSAATGLGQGADALIGPALDPATTTASVNIDITNQVTMTGGSNVGNNRAIIEAGPTSSEMLTFSAGDLVMQGGTGDISNVLIQSEASDLTIDITGTTVSLSGGSGAESSAQILTQVGSSITLDALNAAITLKGGSGSTSSLAEITSSNTSGTGNVTVDGSSLSMFGGSALGDGRALIQTGPSSTSGVLTIMIDNLVKMVGGQNASAIGDNEAIIEALSTNSLSFSAGQLVMQGGTSVTSNTYIQTSSSPITIDLSGRLMTLTGGSGGNSDAVIRTLNGGDVTISAANAFIYLTGGSGETTSRAAIIPGDITGNGSLVVEGRNIHLIGGSGSGDDVAFLGTGPDSTSGSVTVTATNVSLTGGTGSNLVSASIANAQTETGGNLTINATNLTLQGGNSSQTSADGRAFVATSPLAASSTLTLNISGNIQMTGGGPLDGDNEAIIEALPGASNVITITPSPQTLELIGGTGANSSSIFQSGSSSLTIPVSSALTLQGGSGTVSDALITTQTGGDITIDATGATVNMIGGSGNTRARAAIIPDSTSGEGSLLVSAVNVDLTGGTGAGDDAALLSTGPDSLIGSVTISATNDVSLTGGSGSGYDAALISTGNSSTTGSVNISATNNVSLTGGSGSGNDVASITTGASSTTGMIRVSSTNVSLTGGTGSGLSSASIENSPSETGGNITITSTNLTLHGGNAPLSGDGRAFIATSPVAATSTLTLNISDNIHVTGGGPLDGDNEALIQALSTPPSASNSIIFSTAPAPLSLRLHGGSGSNSSSILQTSLSPLIIPISGTTISLQGGSGAISDALIATLDGGDITIDAPSATITMIGGSGSTEARAAILPGETSGIAALIINSDNLNMTGGSGPGDDNAILSTGLLTSSGITLNISRDVTLIGGTASGTNNNAVIETFSSNPITITASSLALNGSITPGATHGSSFISSDAGTIQLNLSNNLILTGGVANHAVANISSLAGLINVLSVQNVGVNGGSGSDSFAQIGSTISTPLSATASIFFNISQNLSVFGGSGANSYAMIGLGDPHASGSNTFVGNISFSTVKDVTVQAGANTGSFAQIGHVNSTSASSSFLSGNISLSSSGNMNLTSTTFSAAYSLIGLGGQNSPSSNETFNGNINVSAHNILINRGSLSNDTFTIIGFVSPSTESHPLRIQSSSLSVTTSANISSGLMPNNAASAGIGALALSADPSASVQIGTIHITTGGSFSFNNPFALIGSSLDFIGTVLNEGTGNTSIKMNIGTDFNFGETALFSMDKAYIFNCNPHNITLNLPITIDVGGDFNLEEFPFFNKVKIQSSGTLDITAGGNVFITGSSKSKTGQTILAGKNFTVGYYGKIQNELSGDILLVADNLNPNPPEIGENIDFSILPTGKVKNQKNEGPVGLYSTTQQNTVIGRPFISPTINGSAFLKGPEFVDTPEEMWGVYYPGGTINPNHPFFTVFYKNNGTPQPVPPPPPPPVLNPAEAARTIYHSNELISQLLFVNWPILDDYLFWAEKFNIRYNLKAHKKLKKKAGYFSSYDLFGIERFTIQRPRDSFYNHEYELLLLRDIRR